jgi:hypothetical protein
MDGVVPITSCKFIETLAILSVAANLFYQTPEMKRTIATLLLVYALWPAGAQPRPKDFYPTHKSPVDVSAKAQQGFERRNRLLDKEKLNPEEQKELNTLLTTYDETLDSVWDIIGHECSWYCGGGNYKIKASSSLPDSSGISYGAKSANDLSYRTVWVEGKKGEGKGEYLEYFFKNESPRITSIIISNGYIKTKAAWHANNRVKTLKLLVNGKPYGLLHLHDTTDDQSFDIGKLGRNKNGSDLVLRFEIVDVYKGDKHNDTAITEIYFDGIDVH